MRRPSFIGDGRRWVGGREGGGIREQGHVTRHALSRTFIITDDSTGEGGRGRVVRQGSRKTLSLTTGAIFLAKLLGRGAKIRVGKFLPGKRDLWTKFVDFLLTLF